MSAVGLAGAPAAAVGGSWGFLNTADYFLSADLWDSWMVLRKRIPPGETVTKGN